MSQFTVCPRCEGHGTTDNENFNGFTSLDRDEWEDDHNGEDFYSAYLGGRMSVPCPACKGKRVLNSEELRDWEDEAEYRAEMARETAYMRG